MVQCATVGGVGLGDPRRRERGNLVRDLNTWRSQLVPGLQLGGDGGTGTGGLSEIRKATGQLEEAVHHRTAVWFHAILSLHNAKEKALCNVRSVVSPTVKPGTCSPLPWLRAQLRVDRGEGGVNISSLFY